MTCVAGLVSNGIVYIGADSAGLSGLHLKIRADKKVFKNHEFIMGFTTSFRMGQILQYSYTPPARGKKIEITKYMATTFIDSVRNILKSGGFAKKEAEVESGGIFLVGYQGHLFEIDSDYQIAESIDGFTSVGCGADIALGSLFSTIDQPPESRILMALQAAEHFSAGVRGPFTILNI